jgi:IclR family pca regulon transcriptional regulator
MAIDKNRSNHREAVHELPSTPEVADISDLDSRDFVASFARGLQVIESFTHERRGISAARISKKTGLSRAAVRRFLKTLEALNYAERSDGIYHLRPSVLRIGSSYLSSSSLPSLAQPILEDISHLIHESTSLCTLDGDNIIYLARQTSSRVLSVGLSVGSRLPAYCTSMGRVLLADLPPAQLKQYLARVKFRKWTSNTVVSRASLALILGRVAMQGYCLVDGELETGLRSLAVPIRNSQGRTVAAMNVGVHVSSVSVEEMISKFLPVLQQHAEVLSRLL